MYTEDQIKIAETFLGTAVNSGVLTQSSVTEMIKKIKCQDEVLLTIPEAQEALKVSRSTIERMLKRGELKGGKFNGSVRIAKSSVDLIIERLAL